MAHPSFTWTHTPFPEFTSGGPDRTALLEHAATASSGTPSKAWQATATTLIAAVGAPAVTAALITLLSTAATLTPDELHRSVEASDEESGVTWRYDSTKTSDVLKGMLWLVPLLPPDPELTRRVASFVEVSLRKVPGVGPQNIKGANAGVYALGAVDTEAALGQLARLASRVTFKTTLKQIDAALTRIAARMGVTRDEIEELAIPAFGLTEVGRREQTLGEATAIVQVSGSHVTLSFITAAGKTVKTAPAAVRAAHPADIAELKATVKDIAKMISAQANRIDQQFLQQRRWAAPVWRQRYLDHPLVGTLARRILWLADEVPVLWSDGALRAVDGTEITLTDDTDIRLWHPVGRPVDEVIAWRQFIEERGIVQPFKQAHREVYLLTPAEENTRTYSNRFAGHVLRQHQMHALASARGWSNRLRLMVDDSYGPPTRHLPGYGIRAEYWVEGLGEDYGVDTLESGSYLYLGTDQVRFYPSDAPHVWAHAYGGGYSLRLHEVPPEGLPLSQIDPLVLSEILRDVDLFVGVTSVGGDPTWSDGGPRGQHREYWQNYSFGALSVSAAERRDLLSRIIPRLAIAPRCRLTDRFLEVDGTLHTYKIHLGSGNILMSPNDRYLCIVTSARATITDPLQLPFDGDRTLSVILSKAAMLAADDTITDETILSQIRAG